MHFYVSDLPVHKSGPHYQAASNENCDDVDENTLLREILMVKEKTESMDREVTEDRKQNKEFWRKMQTSIDTMHKIDNSAELLRRMESVMSRIDTIDEEFQQYKTDVKLGSDEVESKMTVFSQQMESINSIVNYSKKQINENRQEIGEISSTIKKRFHGVEEELNSLKNIHHNVIQRSNASQSEPRLREYKKELSSVKREMQDFRDSLHGWALVISIVIVVSGVCLSAVTFWPSNKRHVFDFNFKQIKQDFPSETDRFWSSIFAPIHRVILEEDPSRPAVIVIATKRSTRTAAECLTRKVATMVEALYGLVPGKSDPYLTLEAQDMKALNPGVARSKLENLLSSNFEQGHVAMVIHDLGSLPSEAAALLHAYGDHESAHFRKAVILATTYLETAVTLNAGEVETHLLNGWEELEKDVLKPLLSRVGNNVAIMSTEITIDYCNTWKYLGMWNSSVSGHGYASSEDYLGGKLCYCTYVISFVSCFFNIPSFLFKP